MTEQEFYKNVQKKSEELGINPFLILAGIEGIYAFKNVPLNHNNYYFLDNLILSIFTLRIGDQFHTIAEENLLNQNAAVMQAAAEELKPILLNDIQSSTNENLKAFADVVSNKTIIRRYHLKALEVAAIESKKLKNAFKNESIGLIMIDILKNDADLEIGNLFS